MTFPDIVLQSGERVIIAYGDASQKTQFAMINAFPAARLDDPRLHWQTEMVMPDDESVLKLFEIQDSTLALRDEVKYGITYNKTAENQSSDSILYILKREAYERFQYTFDRPEFSKMGKISWEEWEDVPYIEGGNVWREIDLKRYELKDHLGNVRVIVSDLRHCKLTAGVPTDFTALIKHYSNYYPFGMEKPAMVWDKGGYRYGFNTQENTDEISGIGNHTTAEFWEYDTRLGRRWNLDPIKKPWQSDYVVFSNNSVWKIDPDGADDFFNSDGSYSHSTKTGTRIYIMTAEKNVLFSELPVNNMPNRKILGNITRYYARSLGMNTSDEFKDFDHDFVGVGNNRNGKTSCGDGNTAFTYGKAILLNFKNGEINPLLSDYNNLKNILVHEKIHRDRGEGYEDPNATQFSKEYKHLSVCLAQIQDGTFKNTTKDFKIGAFGYALQFLTNSFNEETKSSGEIDKSMRMFDLLSIEAKKYGFQLSLKQTVNAFANTKENRYQIYCKTTK